MVIYMGQAPGIVAVLPDQEQVDRWLDGARIAAAGSVVAEATVTAADVAGLPTPILASSSSRHGPSTSLAAPPRRSSKVPPSTDSVAITWHAPTSPGRSTRFSVEAMCSPRCSSTR